jgi:hypothetical protein
MAPTSLAACRAFSDRHAQARMISATVNFPLDLDRPMPVLTQPAQPDDRRPPALSRDPCTHCQARGEVGCNHQRPYAGPDPVDWVPPGKRASARRYDRRAMGRG